MTNKNLKITIVILIFSALAITAFLYEVKFTTRENIQPVTPAVTNQPASPDVKKAVTDSKNLPDIPLSQAGARVTKKPFGIFITPATSPVQPERFRGYHTGADFEILPGEENIDVPVHAVCEGKMRARQFVSGYGGVAIQDCQIKGENVTVLYGHLSLTNIKYNIGEIIKEGEVIGNLGDPVKSETDGERKHLHLGIHKGSEINYRGYVNSKNELSAWIDPCLYFCSPPHQN